MTTIVVPFDGSTFAERALRPACSLAARLNGARVLLVTCAPKNADVVHGQLDDRASLYAGVVDIETRLIEDGRPADAILATVEAEPDAMLCMATHGRGGLRATVMGSVAKQIVRQTTQPLVLVGPQCRTALLQGERGRLLACSDGSAISDNIVPAVATWSARLQLEPWLTEVVPPDESVEHSPDGPRRNREVEAGTARLNKLSARLQSPSITPRIKVLHGHPETSIARYAEQLPAALIAMATHGRGGLSHITIGSIATAVIRRAHCPVLISTPPIPAERGQQP